jgi:2-iminobutanoate/2-iminopropanoate deaminase
MDTRAAAKIIHLAWSGGRLTFMKMLARNPTDGIYAATEDYVHAMEVISPQRFLFISGTMGLEPGGIPGPDLDAQLRLIWSNIRTTLASAGMTTGNIVRLTSYLRDASYADANAAARVAALGQHRVPTTAIVAQTLSPEWLVEIEVVAAS